MQPDPIPVDDFIRPEFNLILPCVIYVLLYHKKPGRINFHWMIDFLSAACLLYGAYQTLWTAAHYEEAQSLLADGIVNTFLTHLVVLWVSKLIFEGRSCIYLMKVKPAEYRMQDLTLGQLVTLAATLFLGINSCFVAISFCVSEFRSFVHLTIDFTVTVYFLLSGVIRSVRVFQQGVVFSTRVTCQPWQFLQDKYRDTHAQKIMHGPNDLCQCDYTHPHRHHSVV